MQINHDLSKPASAHTSEMEWVPSPMPGVERRMLERDGEDGSIRATSIVRYAPGSKFSPHPHPLGEEFFVLEGIFSDNEGDYPAGTYIRNPPGSSHAPHSDGGTTIYVKLQQFDPDDLDHVVVDTNTAEWRPVGDGAERLDLHLYKTEVVYMLRLKAGAETPKSASGGEEILVIDGEFGAGGHRFEKGDWLRNPPGEEKARRTETGCTLLVKEGHFG